MSTQVAGIQLKTKCFVKPTTVGTEILSFTFDLGPLKIICIANIPGEGQQSAPAYIQLELHESLKDWDKREDKKTNE